LRVLAEKTKAYIIIKDKLVCFHEKIKINFGCFEGRKEYADIQ
jgi:hypothetical protein